jgi:hypothetical protein
MHRISLLLLCILMQISVSPAQNNFSEAIGTLGRERSLAEDGASILKHYAPLDIEGRSLYAQGKAAFDEVIEQFLADLAAGHDPQLSPELRTKVEQAVARRLAFSQRVVAVTKEQVPQGAKAGWADALAIGAGELVKQIISGSIMIWREWRTANGDRRKEMAERVEAQRWRSFADIPPEK